MKVAAHGYHAGRPGCAFVLEWNLPYRNPGSATAAANTKVTHDQVAWHECLYCK